MTASSTVGTKGVPRAQREDQIIEIATAEFGARGYAGSSMADIATRVGVTKPLLYQYFGSKDGLYLACLRNAGERLTEGIAKAMDATHEPDEMPLAVLTAIFSTFDDDRRAWSLLHDESLPDDIPEIAETAEGYRRRLTDLAVVGTRILLYDRGLTDGKDIEVISMIWTGIVDSLVSWWISQPDQDATAMIDRCERIMENLFTW